MVRYNKATQGAVTADRGERGRRGGGEDRTDGRLHSNVSASSPPPSPLLGLPPLSTSSPPPLHSIPASHHLPLPRLRLLLALRIPLHTTARPVPC